MTKTAAKNLLASVADEYIREGGDPTALTGYDRVAVLELADALEALGYNESARVARERGAAIQLTGAGNY